MPKRIPFVGGNWKMNLLSADAVALARAVADSARSAPAVEAAVFPPFPYLAAVRAGHASVDAARTVAEVTSGSRKAIMTSWLGSSAAVDARRLFAAAHIPTYETPDAAIRGTFSYDLKKSVHDASLFGYEAALAAYRDGQPWLDALLDYRRLAPHAAHSHPREDHLLPLFVALGASDDRKGHALYKGIAMGTVSLNAFSFQCQS